MNKKRLSEVERPFICGTMFYLDRKTTMTNMKLAELKGADAFEVNLLPLEASEEEAELDLFPLKIGKEDLKDIFAFTEKPVFTTCRRSGPTARGEIIRFSGAEEERMERQLDALELGSSGFDMEFDAFDPNRNPKDQYTENKEAIKKQKEMIQRAHDRGGEVMISCHVFDKALTMDKALTIGLEIQKRGANFAKIVCQNYSYQDMLETFRGIIALKEKLSIPFVYFGMGEHSKLTRVVGPMLGSMLVYATVSKIPIDFLWHQPLIEDMDAVFKHTDWSVTMQGRGDWTKR